MYGRRRVGKTFLIRQAFHNQFSFYVTGTANTSAAQQLLNFQRSLIRYDPSGSRHAVPDNWFTAFHQLSLMLENSSAPRKIIFLDELPWLDTPKSGFIQALEYFWNSFASARGDMVLIVCGSAASWIINKLIHNRGGLHNRVTLRIRLQPFNLGECEEFFRSRGGAFNRYEIVQLYMVMGGIPFYLDRVDTGLSAAQNINKLCFQPNGLLVDEFYDLYSALFSNDEKHVLIIRALSKKSQGLTRAELIAETKLPNAGSTTRILKELEDSGFIQKYAPFEKRAKMALYQLTDFYSLFYLRFIDKGNVLNENIWIVGIDSPQQRAWSGYAFENVCLAHVKQIKASLGISGVQTEYSAWRNYDDGTKSQIDLVIDRRDGVINICEMKFSVKKFTITKKYMEELLRKMESFRQVTKTTKSLYLTLITTFGLQTNAYATSIVQNSLSMDDLFTQP